jgi:Fe-S cluster assembly protein SufD
VTAVSPVAQGDIYREQFEAGADIGAAPEWLSRLRLEAIDRFQAAGFPTSRDEEWRFTPVGPIARGEFRPAHAATVRLDQLAPFLFGHPDWPRLVFVNGRYDASLSAPGAAGSVVRAGNLADAIADGALEGVLGSEASVEASAFTALNTALFRDGACVHVPAGTVMEQPLHVVFVTSADADGTVSHPRNLIIVDRHARASVIESYVTLAPGAAYFTNPVSEVVVGENAWIEHTRIQRESEAAYHVGLTQVVQARDSHYRSFTLAMGGAIARHNLHARHAASNIETLFYGLYLTRGEQLVDNHTAIHHDHPNSNSWEVYKGVLDGRSRAVFNGKVFVKPEAQKTDAKQTNRNLLLSEAARVDTKPQLEIFADDVKCTHGATVGMLDEGGLFYARSRGLSLLAARKLLTYAFAAEVLAEVTLEPVREELDRLVLERLGTLD